MTEPNHLTTPQGRRIAYRAVRGRGPGVVFLGGFRSDMEGAKAQYLHDWAERNGRAFVRFDYSGHGVSGGAFTDGCIGDWTADAAALISAVTEGPQILVGSSMGGWIALLLARAMPARIAGLVGIATAPDFTQDIRAELTDEARVTLARDGQIAKPSDYGEPYIITQRLITEGDAQQVLNRPLHLPFPVRLLQGTADRDVLPAVAIRLFGHMPGDDIRLTLVKGADHRFSTPDCLAMVAAAVTDISGRIG